MLREKIDSNHAIIPPIGTIDINEINSNIYIQSITDSHFSFIHNSLLYTNMKYRINNLISFYEDDLQKFQDDYIEKNNIKDDINEIEKFMTIFLEIYDYNQYKDTKLEKHKKLFDSNKFPMPLCNYKSSFKKEGYFMLDYTLEDIFPSIYSAKILSDFLNNDFSNFDIFFEFFTKFFPSFIDLLNKTDRKNFKQNNLYEFDVIVNLAKKYQASIIKVITKYQILFKNLIDYTYNYTNDNDIINEFDPYFEPMKRFLVFRRINFLDFNYLINNIKTTNLYDVELYPVDTEKIYDKDILLKKFNKEYCNVNCSPKTYTNNVFSYFYYMIYTIIFNASYTIKKCKNCNKYFITYFDSNQLYCENIYSGTQTCKDIGNQIAQLKKQKYDLVYGKYRKIYSKKAMLVKRNPDIKSYKTEYENWKKEAQEYRDKLKKEEITNEEFEKWLDTNK